jgi:nucleoside-diphosphate-sugar epimerase
MARSAAGRTFVEDLGAESFLGAVEQPEGWDAAGTCDAIVHAAALVVDPVGWERYRAVNVHGTRLAVETAARHGARLVHVSSVAVYGRRPESDSSAPVAEDAPFQAIAEPDYYARSKRLAEATLWQRAEELGISAVALRPCVMYGERERLFMSRALGMLRFGIAPIIDRGDNRLAMVYAGNVVEAVLAALERPDVRGAFNTTNDGGLTQREFFEIIAQASGRRLRLVRLPLRAAVTLGKAWHTTQRLLRPGRYAGIGSSGGRFMARENPYTSAKAGRELGWRPSTPPREGLRRTVEWFVAQR